MRAKTCIALFASLAVLAGTTLAQTWTTGAPLPTERDAFAWGVIDGKLYVVGGFGGSRY